MHVCLSNFNSILAPKHAKPNGRELYWSHGGTTLTGLRYEKAAVVLWTHLQGNQNGTKPAEGCFHWSKNPLENPGSQELQGCWSNCTTTHIAKPSLVFWNL